MNIAWAKEWLGSFNAAGLEKLFGMYAEDVQFEDITFSHKCSGLAEVKKFFAGMASPGAGENVFTANAYVGDTNGGVVEWTWQAKHAGEFLGIPAQGKQTNVRGVSVLTFRGGKITSQHDYWDANTAIQQLKK
jgi:steroid delta-isomerase-like uncharacterized protein